MTETIQLDIPASPVTITIEAGASPVAIEYAAPALQLDMTGSGPTGPQGSGTQTFTAFALTIMDDVDAAAVRATIGAAATTHNHDFGAF